MNHMTDHDEADLALYDDVDFWAQQLEQSGIRDARPEQVMSDARDYRELEALVKVLDSLETIASLVLISAEYVIAVPARYSSLSLKANRQTVKTDSTTSLARRRETSGTEWVPKSRGPKITCSRY